MRIALIGRNEARLGGVPYGDPSWSLWGLAWDPVWRDRCNVLFDPHWPRNAPGVVEYLETLDRPVYLDASMLRPEYPTALAYPLYQIERDVTPYLESSIAYMMAMAIHLAPTEIGLYGISMNGTSEYAYQRPNMEYLMGLAEGRGIKVTQDNTQRQPGLLISAWGAGRYGELDPI